MAECSISPRPLRGEWRPHRDVMAIRSSGGHIGAGRRHIGSATRPCHIGSRLEITTNFVPITAEHGSITMSLSEHAHPIAARPERHLSSAAHRRPGGATDRKSDMVAGDGMIPSGDHHLINSSSGGWSRGWLRPPEEISWPPNQDGGTDRRHHCRLFHFPPSDGSRTDKDDTC